MLEFERCEITVNALTKVKKCNGQQHLHVCISFVFNYKMILQVSKANGSIGRKRNDLLRLCSVVGQIKNSFAYPSDMKKLQCAAR